jgi:hypothetical protein
LLQKQELIESLVRHGDLEKAWEVEDRLPEVLDTEKDRGLLARHDIDVEALVEPR